MFEDIHKQVTNRGVFNGPTYLLESYNYGIWFVKNM